MCTHTHTHIHHVSCKPTDLNRFSSFLSNVCLYVCYQDVAVDNIFLTWCKPRPLTCQHHGKLWLDRVCVQMFWLDVFWCPYFSLDVSVLKWYLCSDISLAVVHSGFWLNCSSETPVVLFLLFTGLQDLPFLWWLSKEPLWPTLRVKWQTGVDEAVSMFAHTEEINSKCMTHSQSKRLRSLFKQYSQAKVSK